MRPRVETALVVATVFGLIFGAGVTTFLFQSKSYLYSSQIAFNFGYPELEARMKRNVLSVGKSREDMSIRDLGPTLLISVPNSLPKAETILEEVWSQARDISMSEIVQEENIVLAAKQSCDEDGGCIWQLSRESALTDYVFQNAADLIPLDYDKEISWIAEASTDFSAREVGLGAIFGGALGASTVVLVRSLFLWIREKREESEAR